MQSKRRTDAMIILFTSAVAPFVLVTSGCLNKKHRLPNLRVTIYNTLQPLFAVPYTALGTSVIRQLPCCVEIPKGASSGELYKYRVICMHMSHICPSQPCLQHSATLMSTIDLNPKIVSILRSLSSRMHEH